jgi:hypothetical protein
VMKNKGRLVYFVPKADFLLRLPSLEIEQVPLKAPSSTALRSRAPTRFPAKAAGEKTAGKKKKRAPKARET